MQQEEDLLAAPWALSPEQRRALGLHLLDPSAPSSSGQQTAPHPTAPPPASPISHPEAEDVVPAAPSLLIGPPPWSKVSEQTDTTEDDWCGLPLLNQSAYSASEEFVEKSRNCVLKSVFECKEGIFEFLLRSGGDLVWDMVLKDAILDENAMRLECIWRSKSKRVNAFTFFRECLRCDDFIMREIVEEDEEDDEDPFGYLGFAKEEKDVPTKEERQEEYFQFLPKMLEVLQRSGLIHIVGEMISNKGLRWTGAMAERYWMKVEPRAQLEQTINFFIDNKAHFKDIFRRLLAKEGEEITCSYMASFTPDVFFKFLDAMLDKESMEKMLFSTIGSMLSLHSAWHFVVKNNERQQVKGMWEYLERKLVTRERVRDFLQRKDPDNEDVLFMACCNDHHFALPFVWELYGRFFDHSERTKLLHDSITGVRSYGSVCHHLFLAFLLSLLESGQLDGQEVTKILLREETGWDGYQAKTLTYPFLRQCTGRPHNLYHLQALLLSGKLDDKAIMSNMEGQYKGIIGICRNRIAWSEAVDILAEICSDFDALRSSNDTWMDASLLEERELLSYGRTAREQEENGIFLKVFYMITERQVRFERKHLSEGDIVARLATECMGIYTEDKWQWKKGDVRETCGHLISHFFNALSPLLSKEGLERLLFHHYEEFGSPFIKPMLMLEEDALAFLALYDVARWLLAEEALWRVFSLPGPESYPAGVLQLVLRLQEDGHFDPQKE